MLVRTFAMVLTLLLAGNASAQPVMAGALSIAGAWVRPTPPGAPTAAGYLSITNTGHDTDRLVGASSPEAARVELHATSMDGGVMRMRPVEGGLAIPPGATVSLAPGGMHLMIIAPLRRFAAGEAVEMTLMFARAGAVHVMFAVHPAAP